jgi:hypothetical protein
MEKRENEKKAYHIGVVKVPNMVLFQQLKTMRKGQKLVEKGKRGERKSSVNKGAVNRKKKLSKKTKIYGCYLERVECLRNGIGVKELFELFL